MKQIYYLSGAFFLVISLSGCFHFSYTSAVSSPQPEQFKNAIIAYMDGHSGCFIGRRNSAELKTTPIVLWGKDDDGHPTYSLAEFLIFPSKMRFHADYGIHSVEPYLYEGEFIKTADDNVAVGKVRVTRLHMDPNTLPKAKD